MSDQTLYRMPTMIRRTWRERLFTLPWRPWVKATPGTMVYGGSGEFVFAQAIKDVWWEVPPVTDMPPEHPWGTRESPSKPPSPQAHTASP